MPERIFSFERLPYQRELDTRVLEVGQDREGHFAVLRDTICYPEGGGQPGDRGWLDEVEIVDTIKQDGRILHYLSGPVESGPAHLRLDWSRRFDHMQQHTAQHLLTALAADRFRRATTAFHLGEERSDIELDGPELTAGQLTDLEEQAAIEIRAARPIRARRVSLRDFGRMKVRTRGLPADHDGSVRLVEIEDIDLNTCGGTHLSNTSEIELISLLGWESARGGIRLFFVAGRRARRRLADHEARNRRLRSLLGTSDVELSRMLEQRLEQHRESGRLIRRLEEELSTLWAEKISSQAGPVLEGHFEGRTASFLQLLGRHLSTQAEDRVAFLTASSMPGAEEGFFLLAAGERFSGSVSALGRLASEIVQGRGGGGGRIFQGKAQRLSQREEAARALRERLE